MSRENDHWEAYPSDVLVTTERALFEAWDSLEKFHRDLVVVGGLAIHYHTRNKVEPLYFAAPTLDVDFGISLGTDAGMKGSVQFDLSLADYQGDDEGRMVKTLKNGERLYIDFLTEHPPSEQGTRNVSDVTASICPGINRALEVREYAEIRGIDRLGDERTFQIPICGIGPLLVLKLNAFAKRQDDKKAKDAYDILVAVTAYSGGADAAIRAFQAEKLAGNPAMDLALKTLARDFAEINGAGAAAASRFRYGSGKDSAFAVRLQTDLVSVAQALLES